MLACVPGCIIALAPSMVTPDDLDLASAALDLIAERGYHRGKDLQAEYRSLLARFRPGH
jgi:hypothetical protein